VNERQAYALEHPLDVASGRIDALAGGNLLRSILAVDR
jgi:hypothetical protein